MSNLATQSETTYFSDQLIMVSDKRIVTGGTTYPMNGITAVTCKAHNAGTKDKGVYYLIGAIATGIVSRINAGGMVVMGIIAAVLLLLSIKNFMAKSVIYTLQIETAGNQSDLLANYSAEYIQAVAEAVNQAIIARG